MTRVLLALALTGSASAHEMHGGSGGFASGFHHPWAGLDHVIAMIAVGLWGAQFGKPAVWLLPVAFPMLMAFGGFLALAGIHLPEVELGIALSAVLLGAAVAFEFKPVVKIAIVLVGIFGLFHGHAHGAELPEGQNGFLYSLGFVIATGCLHGVGIGLGIVHRWKRGALAIRCAGAAISIMGMRFAIAALA